MTSVTSGGGVTLCTAYAALHTVVCVYVRRPVCREVACLQHARQAYEVAAEEFSAQEPVVVAPEVPWSWHWCWVPSSASSRVQPVGPFLWRYRLQALPFVNSARHPMLQLHPRLQRLLPCPATGTSLQTWRWRRRHESLTTLCIGAALRHS